MKKELDGIPLVATNRINTPEVAESILADGCADMVSMARPFLADPDFVVKAVRARPPTCVVVCCVVLCCAVLCCAVLCCAVLCCVVLFLDSPVLFGCSPAEQTCPHPCDTCCDVVWCGLTGGGPQ